MDVHGLISLINSSKYAILFFGSYTEGTLVMISAGLLWHEGLLAFTPAYIALIIGDILSDCTWYFVGYFGARPFIKRWGYLVNVDEAKIDRIEMRFKKHQTTILLGSKLTLGFGLMIATLLTAGILRVPIKKFIIVNLFGGFVWIFGLMLLGYYFGDVFSLIPGKYKIALVIVLLGAAFFAIKYISTWLAKKDW